MKTFDFKATSKMGKLYAAYSEMLKKKGHEFGFVQVVEEISIEYDGLTYTVKPFDVKKLCTVGDYKHPYADITVVDSKTNKAVDDKRIQRDVIAAICLLHGGTVAVVNEKTIWLLSNGKRSLVWTLAKYVGIAVALIVVAGICYAGYKAATE